MAKADYYEVLGVARGASADELKKSYRKLAMQCHPDRNPGDKASEQRFKDINEAYDVLKDDQKRAAYDRFGHAAFEANGGGGFRGGQGFDFSAGFADIFDEMFGDFAGGRRRGGGATRGADLRFNLEIGLDEAFRGTQAKIRVPTAVACEVCNGSGGEGGAQPSTCQTCHGHGRVRAQQGLFAIERTCPSCHGSGQVITHPCRTCHGSGRLTKDKTLSVSIPAGVEEGTRIRLAGEGEAGLRGAPAGDLYIFLSIKAHPIFKRDGANIFCRVPIPMATASLGGNIEVPTIDGARARVAVPAGTQTGHQFRLRGKGMSVLRSQSRGDMYIEAVIETPVNLTKRQRELLRVFEVAGGGGKTHSPQSEGFFAKVREFFTE